MREAKRGERGPERQEMVRVGNRGERGQSVRERPCAREANFPLTQPLTQPLTWASLTCVALPFPSVASLGLSPLLASLPSLDDFGPLSLLWASLTSLVLSHVCGPLLASLSSLGLSHLCWPLSQEARQAKRGERGQKR